MGATGYLGRVLYNQTPASFVPMGTTRADVKNLTRLDLNYPNEFNYNHISEKDTLILTAAISAPDVCSSDFENSWNLNVEGTTKFINRATERGARIIFCSSDAIYGETSVNAFENTPPSPLGEYAKMKLEVENRSQDNPLFKAIRLSYIFSNEDKFTKYLISCAKLNSEAEVFHPFNRAVIYRQDVVDGIFSLAQKWEEFPQKIINFGGHSTISRVDFSKLMQKIAIPNLQLKIVEPADDFFSNRPRVISMKSQTLEKLLGRETTTLEQAIKKEFL